MHVGVKVNDLAALEDGADIVGVFVRCQSGREYETRGEKGARRYVAERAGAKSARRGAA